MKWYVFTALLILVFVSGWTASSITQKSSKPAAQQTQSRTQPLATNGVSASTEPLDIYSGNGMTPAALYNALDGLSGTDFDKRYINYVILLQSTLDGINRLAKEKAVAPAFRERASQLWSLDSQRLSNLYTLQKVQGYTHH